MFLSCVFLSELAQSGGLWAYRRGFFFTFLERDCVNRALAAVGIAPTITLARLLARTVFDFTLRWGRIGARLWSPRQAGFGLIHWKA